MAHHTCRLDVQPIRQLKLTTQGRGGSREPSHANDSLSQANDSLSQYNPQLYNSTPYPQPLNSFLERNQSISYPAASTPMWREPPQQVYQPASLVGNSFRDEPSYTEHNPSPNTDPHGMRTEIRYGRLISSTEGERQQLDPFKEDHRRFFTPGRVFKLYWAAPRGSNAPQSEPEGSVFNCGPHVHAKIQRFVVVKPDHSQGYSYCLPISTNKGQGAAKKGLRQEEHTIVYTSPEAPLKLASETRLHKTPIKIDLVNPSEKLDPCSRLNLGKFYPVEHNVRVCEVGEITGPHKRLLLHYSNSEVTKRFSS
ncbi:hypothetical protein MMC22_005367 [Lobaria immixta]|nr:hypothetical protein [Lobaria immixta]